MDKTKIRWADATWNFFSGCTKVSAGCKNCYAEVLAERMRGGPAFPVGFDPVFKPQKLRDPYKWKEPKRIFVNSMSDVFHEEFTDEMIDQGFAVMKEVDRHQYLVLTKRPERMADYIAGWLHRNNLDALPPHIWPGTSIERDDFVWRADVLRTIRSPRRFISAEPLLGPLPSLDLEGIAWLIVGGESGNNFRPMELDWARDLVNRALEKEGPAIFFKQQSHRRTEAIIDLDGKLYEEWPDRRLDSRRDSQWMCSTCGCTQNHACQPDGCAWATGTLPLLCTGCVA